MPRPREVGQAILEACMTELRALKPGNVHSHADGHGMTVADFESSARALARVYGRGRQGVGRLILSAVEETFEAVGCNTNLGIVLLTAPLAEAALLPKEAGLRGKLKHVLRSLDRDDAALAFQAIRLAEPGGLGRSESHDVAEPARASLREIMAVAKDRDRVARQYATDYADIFEFGLPRLAVATRRWRNEGWAVASLYLDLLSTFPDSHVARKYGSNAAEALRARAEPYAARMRSVTDPNKVKAELLAFDTVLKSEGINPGTSADLTVASHFAHGLEALLSDRL